MKLQCQSALIVSGDNHYHRCPQTGTRVVRLVGRVGVVWVCARCSRKAQLREWIAGAAAQARNSEAR